MGNNYSQNMIKICVDMDDDRLSKYFNGFWYEQVRYDFFYQEGCENSFAKYEIQLNRRTQEKIIKITNGCTIFKNGKKILKQQTGEGFKIENAENKGAFKVIFNLFDGENDPISITSPPGGYFIIHLENEDNENGISFVVGNDFKQLWILTRTQNITTQIQERICNLINNYLNLGYPIKPERMIWNDLTYKCIINTNPYGEIKRNINSEIDSLTKYINNNY